MLPEHHAVLEEEACPVADQLLGEIYRASAHGLNELIATVSRWRHGQGHHGARPEAREDF
jgi:hypothetical protein